MPLAVAAAPPSAGTTALGAALRSAGLRTTKERLEELATAAAKEAGGNYEKALDALWRRIGDDAAILRDLLTPHKNVVLRPVLMPVLARLRTGGANYAATPGHSPRSPSARDAVNGGHSVSGTRSTGAPEDGRGGRGHSTSDGHNDRSASPPSLSRSEQIKLATASSLARQTILDTHVTEFDRPLGDCTQDDLQTLARRNKRRGWFYTAVAQAMPATGTVRQHCPADEVDALWSRSLRNEEGVS